MKRKSIRVRYIRSFLLIVIIPIIIFSIFFYWYDVHNTENNIKNARLIAFNQSATQVSVLFNEIRSAAISISTELDSFVEFKEFGENINSTQIIAALTAQKNALNYEIEPCFYIRGHSDMFFGGGRIDYQQFETEYSESFDVNISSFFGKLNSIKAQSAFELSPAAESDSESGFTTLMFPLPYTSALPSCTVAFLLPQPLITDIFNNTLGDFSANVYIFNRLNEVVYMQEDLPNGPDIQKVRKQKGIGIIPQSADGKEYVIMRGISEDNTLVFVAVMERGEFYKTTEPARKLLITLIAVLLVLCVLMAISMAHYNYRPIKNLMSDLTGLETENPSGDEFTVIKSSYQKSQDQKKKLETQVRFQSTIVRDQFLLNLLQGRISTADEIQYTAEQLAFPLSFLNYMVILAAIPDIANRRIVIDKAAALGKQFICGNAHVYALETGLDERIACICCFDCAQSELESYRQSIAEAVIGLYSQSGIGQMIWGVGMVYSRPSELRTSFMEATAVLQSAYLKYGQDRYFYEPPPKNDTSDSSIPVMVQSLLVESIRYGDAQTAIASFNSIVEQINRTSKSFLITQMLCFDVLNIILKLLSQLNLAANFSDYKTTDTFHSLPEFQRQVSHIIETACTEILQRREASQNHAVQAVEQFIEENFTDSNLSLDYVSEAFNISKARVNAISREKYGLSFAQCIAELRMKEVKRRLLDTKDQVQDIVTSVGYIDVPNFMRKFKKSEGLTPGQYRQIYGNNP